MTLPAKPPSTAQSQLPLRTTSEGWPVFALQKGLRIKADGLFGSKTDDSVRAFQEHSKLAVDGVAGPATRAKIAFNVCADLSEEYDSLPKALPKRLAQNEGGDNLAAVNWSMSGGVDCGLFQLRVLGPPYNKDRLEAAFDSQVAGERSLDNISNNARIYAHPHEGCPYTGVQLAVLSHNWPAGAAQLFRTGRLSTPTAIASWAPTSLPASERTYAGWCARYIRVMTQ